MWTHLIKVPLAVRAAGPTDIPALLRLQDASLSNLRVQHHSAPYLYRLQPALTEARLARPDSGRLETLHRSCA